MLSSGTARSRLDSKSAYRGPQSGHKPLILAHLPLNLLNSGRVREMISGAADRAVLCRARTHDRRGTGSPPPAARELREYGARRGEPDPLPPDRAFPDPGPEPLQGTPPGHHRARSSLAELRF